MRGKNLWLLPVLRPAGWPLIAAITAVSIVASAAPAATAVAMGALVGEMEHAVGSAMLTAALVPLLMFAVVLLVRHALDALREPLEFDARVRVDGAQRSRVFGLVSRMPTIEALEESKIQRLIRVARARPDNWTERTAAEGALAQLQLFTGLLGLIASSAVLVRYAWWPLPVLLLPGIVSYLIRSRQTKAHARAWRDGIAEGLRAGVFTEPLYSPGDGKEVRVYGLADWLVDRSQWHLHRMFDPVWATARRAAGQEWRQLLLIAVPLGITLTAVVGSAVRGTTSVEVEAAVFGAAWSVYHALGYGWGAQDMHSGRQSLSAVDELAEALGETPAPSGNGNLGRSPYPEGVSPDGAGAPLVRFEGVSFRYPGTDRTILDGLDLEIRPAELLAIVGLNGAGKSTLIKLLAGLYRPTEGRITADGIDIAAIDAQTWRQRISVVFQDFVRYPLPAADNVAFGQASVPRDESAISAAARDAGLTALIDGLPQGWRTPLDRSRTDGVDLSGGQWQQVVLARALYAQHTGAGLLVLDEPTAHLDVRTEFDVFGRLAARRSDAGVVLISHRLSTVRQADRIVLLNGGRITESGTHEELIDLGGDYAEMFAIQSERFHRGYDDRIEEGDLA